MHRVALAFAYDGTRFDSFARQPGRRTVESELIRAVREAGMVPSTSSGRFEAGSRTDRGVSAWWNVCAFDSDAHPQAIVHSARTADGLFLLGASRVPADFSPRRAATLRAYRYWVPAWKEYDLQAVRAAAKLFAGRHDYRNFCRPEPGVATHRRIDRIVVRSDQDWGLLRFEAQNFLWEQIRRITSAVLAVGAGRRTLASVAGQLDHPSVRRPEPPAAPEFLVLEKVHVPVHFRSASRSLWERVHDETRRQAVRSRFFSGLADKTPTARR